MVSLENRINLLQNNIDYVFVDRTIAIEAISHSSFVNEKATNNGNCNERLEFLGDAVLELVSSNYLFKMFSSSPEGLLTRYRASMVCEPSLADMARRLNIGDIILLGRGEAASGGNNRNSILSDCLEAIIGAVYIDGGYDAASEFIEKYILAPQVDSLGESDYKTKLQELVQQKHMGELIYQLISESGPDHKKTFSVEAYLDNQLIGNGSGATKKKAEQEAAKAALNKLI